MKYTSLRTTIASLVVVASFVAAPLAFAAATPTTHHISRPTTTIAPKKITEARKGMGGKVTAISGTTITVSSLGKSPVSYTIDASKAHIVGKNIKTVSDIHIGDEVAILGDIVGSNVAAQTVVDRPASMGTPKAFAKLHGAKPVKH